MFEKNYFWNRSFIIYRVIFFSAAEKALASSFATAYVITAATGDDKFI
jgi:hypothetical protein